MVKKLALTSLFNNNRDTSSCPSSPPPMSACSNTAGSWQWPSCRHPRTLSFREDGHNGGEHHRHKDYKTINPAYLFDRADSCFSNTSSSTEISESLLTASEPSGDADEDEVIIHGLRSNRLFFEPESTSSILKASDGGDKVFEGATVMAIDSEDPYGDFRKSMEEMVMSHGVKDWGWLEEMLGWYLEANGKKTHGLIVGAFLDLLVTLASSPSTGLGVEKGTE